MNIEDKNIDKTIYDICILIHSVTKLDLEFIDNNNSSFYLVNSQKLQLLDTFKQKTFLLMHHFLRNKESKDFLCYTDSLQLSCLAAGIWKDKTYQGTIVLGPFLASIPDEKFITSIIEQNHLPLGYRLQMHQYYTSLTILDINQYRNIGNLMINLCSNPFLHGAMSFRQDIAPETNKEDKNELEQEEFYSDIELRYKMEKNILKAVERGSKEEALKLRDVFQFSATHRVPNDPLRAYKNLSFSFNTLLRIAAERGGVSPIYIHNLSDKFATLIEKVTSIAELENFQKDMVSEYCDLVNKFSTAGKSPTVVKAINYINLNFEKRISLSIIAENIGANPSHLSRQFKKETNLTITEFIHKRRIDESKFLINQNNNSITNIALMVGFENHNYFCTVFKQITSLTPSDYLNKVRDK